MLQLSTLYQGEDALNSYLIENKFNPQIPSFIRVFTTFTDDETILGIIKSVKNVLPHSLIFGATSAYSLIHDTKLHNNATVILINAFEKLSVNVHSLSYTDRTFKQIAQELNAFHNPSYNDNVCTHIFITKNDWHIDDLMEQMNASFTPLSLRGGVVEKVFTDNGILENTILSFSLKGKDVTHFAYPSTAAEVISPLLHFTKTSKHRFIDEIENIPTKKWLYDYFEIEKTEKCSLEAWPEENIYSYLNHFPIISQKHGNARYITYEPNTQKFSLYSSEVLDNMPFRMAYVTPQKVVDETYKACTQILSVPVESVFVYSCFIRKMTLKNCAQWELTPYASNKISGMLMYGEICYFNGKNMFYNGTCCITGFAENERYILPDTSAVKKNATLDCHALYYDKALEKQKQTQEEQSITLRPVACDLNAENCQDESIGLPNLFQFEDDFDAGLCDKVALVEVLTADTLIAFLGQQRYSKVRSRLSRLLEYFIAKHNLQEFIYLYALNYKTFILAANSAIDPPSFIAFAKSVYERFEYSGNEKDLEDTIIRIAVSNSKKNMIQVAMNTLFTKRDSQDSFIVCDVDTQEEDKDKNDLQCIELIKKALENDLVIPYYQGIRDNQTKSITKYESLMRIVDEKGKVYYPDYFLDVAKKYKFYNRLSKKMIEKALRDFENKETAISINISLYDVESEDFRNWILTRLSTYPLPERVVIELVETESFRSSEHMLNFIKDVHRVGSKVAIDDFGAGYSTFLTIAQVRPDFIKIDGSIIKEIAHNETSLILVECIALLARRLGTQSIAEFVDNEEVQEILEKNFINYSQGFYFAKPVPLHELTFLK